MTAPDPGLDALERQVRRRLSRLIPFAYAALLWERLWPRLWPVIGVVGAFIALALLDVFPMMPFWLHGMALAGFAAVSAWALYAGTKTLHLPTLEDVRNRIERDSHLDHRPLAVLDDEDVSKASNRITAALWDEHRRRAAKASWRLRVGIPEPGLARFDPYGLRVAVALALIIAITAASDNATVRMARALTPVDHDFGAGARIDLWVTPPAYTGFPPFHVFRNDQTKSASEDIEGDETFIEVRTIPVGSAILAQVGTDEIPDLIMPQRTLAFEEIGASGYRLETTVGASDVAEGVGSITVQVDKKEIATWPVRIIDDVAPTIEFTQAPGNTGRGRLRVAFAAEDDFGLTRATLVIRNPDIPADHDEGDTVRVDLPMSRSGAVSIETAVVRDLSEHDWAGLPTEVRLEAWDALGQIGRSDVFPMILPERIFNHPVARALNEFRKTLVNPSESEAREVIAGLDGLSVRPDHFNHDTVVFLALRVARARLSHDGSDGVMKPIRRLLWNTALRIEDGEFALAGRELSEVQEALDQALRDGAYSEALEELLDALTNALDRFLAALGEQLDEKGMDNLSDIPGLSYLDENDLKSLIEDARELARTGSMDAAQATLDELRNLLSSIESAMSSDSPMDEFSEVREMMEKLSGISQDQQGLLDNTFRQMRRAQGSNGNEGAQPLNGEGSAASGNSRQMADQGDGEEGEQTGRGPGEVARSYAPQQDGLRRDLGDLMLDLDQLIGMLPESLNDAKISMKRAVEALMGADPGGAVGHQSEALEALRQGMEQVAEQVARQLRAMPGNLPSAQGTLPNSGSDPFGRMGGGAMGSRMDDGSVKVPSRMDMRRAREIYEELRRRAGNLKRPLVEREYIQRLLRQF